VRTVKDQLQGSTGGIYYINAEDVNRRRKGEHIQRTSTAW
jgi:hypothetical protein